MPLDISKFRLSAAEELATGIGDSATFAAIRKFDEQCRMFQAAATAGVDQLKSLLDNRSGVQEFAQQISKSQAALQEFLGPGALAIHSFEPSRGFVPVIAPPRHDPRPMGEAANMLLRLKAEASELEGSLEGNAFKEVLMSAGIDGATINIAKAQSIGDYSIELEGFDADSGEAHHGIHGVARISLFARIVDKQPGPEGPKLVYSRDDDS